MYNDRIFALRTKISIFSQYKVCLIDLAIEFSNPSIEPILKYITSKVHLIRVSVNYAEAK